MFVASALLSTAARANGRSRCLQLRRARWRQLRRAIAFYSGINEKMAVVGTAQRQDVMELVSALSYTWYLRDARVKEVASRGSRTQVHTAAHVRQASAIGVCEKNDRRYI